MNQNETIHSVVKADSVLLPAGPLMLKALVQLI